MNPDKGIFVGGILPVVMGYGEWLPRVADRWAAASMMSGHPGEVSQVNLRHVPFLIWMGRNDGYDQNKLAVEKGQ